MLKKLLKYDWTLSWKIPTVMCGSMMLITLAAIPMLNHSIWNTDSEFLVNLALLVAIFYLFLLWACPTAVFAYMGIRYYKNLYTDEGYLTATLPVFPWQIVLSKLMITGFWNLVSVIVMILGTLCLTVAVGDIKLYLPDLEDILEVLHAIIYELLEMNYVTAILFILLLILSSAMFSILMVFASIALGQMFTGHRIAGAILWYVILSSVVQFFGFFFISVPAFSLGGLLDPGISAGIRLIFSLLLLLTLLADAVLFFICEYSLRKKLNLE